MVTTGALLHGDRDRFLAFDPSEHPLAIQLGGNNPTDLAYCADLAQSKGFDEVNLNVGCPSNRVQSGAFGACLMAEPKLVASCVSSMSRQVDIDVTVKCRIGIDEQDDYLDLERFVNTVAETGCKTFIIHARKAWLKGLSPKENREIPPLQYDSVYRIKQTFPSLEVIINGGITTMESCQQHLQQLDGVMVGREAYQNPFFLSPVDQLFFSSDQTPLTRHEILQKLMPYIEKELKGGVYLSHITRHLLGLFHAQPGAKQFRRYISENAHKRGAGLEVVKEAMKRVPEPTTTSKMTSKSPLCR